MTSNFVEHEQAKHYFDVHFGTTVADIEELQGNCDCVITYLGVAESDKPQSSLYSAVAFHESIQTVQQFKMILSEIYTQLKRIYGSYKDNTAKLAGTLITIVPMVIQKVDEKLVGTTVVLREVNDVMSRIRSHLVAAIEQTQAANNPHNVNCDASAVKYEEASLALATFGNIAEKLSEFLHQLKKLTDSLRIVKIAAHFVIHTEGLDGAKSELRIATKEFKDLVEALKNPDHPIHDEVTRRLVVDFPAKFGITDVENVIKTINQEYPDITEIY